jgi:hypothetical protein
VRIGILADIREHVEHLDAALARLRHRGATRLVVMGDVIADGRLAAETVARLESAGAVGVRGEGDLDRAGDLNGRDGLPAPVRAYLGRLADRFEIDGVLFARDEPWLDTDGPPESPSPDGPTADAERARRTFAAIPQRVAVLGSLRRWLAVDGSGPIAWDPAEPLRLDPGGRYVLGVPAVDDGWCALLDTTAGEMEAIDVRERPRQPLRSPERLQNDGAGALLDRLRERPAADDAGREAVLADLVARFPAAVLREALRGRMGEVGGAHGSILLRLVESLGDPTLLDELATALERGPAPPAERAWEALSLLDSAGALEDRPALAEAYDELVALLEDDGEASLAELASQLEEEPDGVVLALEGLAGVEPDVRAAIVAGLAGQPVGPGLVEFLRLLAHGPDEATRAAALGVLSGLDPDNPIVATAWFRLARESDDPEVAARAGGRVALAAGTAPLPAPLAVRAAVVGDLDADGRAALGFVARDTAGAGWSAAVFSCDVSAGVIEVQGLHAEDEADARAALGAIPGLASGGNPGTVGLARDLLAGCLLLGGPGAPTALRYWVERAVGADLRPRPLPAGPLLVAAGGTPEGLRGDARAVLEALPGWRDAAPLTLDLARELAQRADGGPVDDPAARRLLFERRVRDRVPLLQRMLIWQALVWQAAGAGELAGAAGRLAASLLGPEQLVPTHPFLDVYLRRSLEWPGGEPPAGGGRTQRRLS